MSAIRRPAVAGSFYPAGRNELQKNLEECSISQPLGPMGNRDSWPNLIAGIVPHAGTVYSGPCAAHFYAHLPPDVERVVVLGVNHHGLGAKAALSPAESWQTPLGKVKIEKRLAEALKLDADFLVEDALSHAREHSIEIELPFLQKALSDFTFLPVSLYHLTAIECANLGKALAKLHDAAQAQDKKIVLIASSDLSHYLSPDETERLDRLALEKILQLDPEGLLKTVAENEISMCGVIPTAVLLFAANVLGARKARLLKHCHSGDAAPMREVVGYASVAVEF